MSPFLLGDCRLVFVVCRVLKKSQATPEPPQPRPSASFSDKRWSSAPPKPNTTLEISGPLLEDPPGYDDYVHNASAVPSSAAAPSKPIFKPSASKPSAVVPKLNPPASGAAAVPPVVIAGRERKSFHGSNPTAPPLSDVDGAPDGPALEAGRPSRMLNLNSLTAESTLKRQQKEKEAKKSEDRPSVSSPSSPTKGSRRVRHSQSLREPRANSQLEGGDKVVKRESFRGTEISSPILVSTTNRDSQMFADFELDESGVIARPIGKQNSVHGSNPSSDGVRDGCRSPVRRTQSDRPLSPKLQENAPDTDIEKPTTQQSQVFAPRPLPPEPEEDEPLYANEGLSDLDDLKAQISSAFEGFSLNMSPANNPPEAKPVTAPKPSLAGRSSQPASSTGRMASKPALSSTGAPAKPSQGSTTMAPKLSQNILNKATPLEKVLSNSMKAPFGSSDARTTLASRQAGRTSMGPSAESKITATSKPEATGNVLPAGASANTGSSAKQPFSSSVRVSDSTKKGPTDSRGTAATKAPSAHTVNSTMNKSTPGISSKGSVKTSTGDKGLNATSKIASNNNNNKFSAKGPSAGLTSKGLGSGVKGPSAAAPSKVRSAEGTTSSPAGRVLSSGTGLQRSGSGSNRPAVAPKPGTNKAVRSYNF